MDEIGEMPASASEHQWGEIGWLVELATPARASPRLKLWRDQSPSTECDLAVRKNGFAGEPSRHAPQVCVRALPQGSQHGQRHPSPSRPRRRHRQDPERWRQNDRCSRGRSLPSTRCDTCVLLLATLEAYRPTIPDAYLEVPSRVKM